MASIKWDHTVHYVNDLDQAIQTFQQAGLVAAFGGKHTDWGTYNALSYFDLSYLEFLGVEDPGLASQADPQHVVVKDAVKHLPQEEILSRVALRTDDIEALAVQLKERGAKLSEIFDGKRHDAEGNLIEWRMLSILGDIDGLPYPFVIQWGGTEDQRRKQLTQAKVIQQHPAGELAIVRAVFEVADPEKVIQQWQQFLGFQQVEINGEEALQVGNQSFVFTTGPANRLQQIVFEGSPALKGKQLTIGQGTYLFQ